MPETTSDDPAIFFEDTGHGTPVVLGHSFLCSGEMWRGQVSGLTGRYRLINVDFRGHGRSDASLQPFTLYDAVDDVVAVLDELGINKAVWCGLSIGGMVALRAALEKPERVSGLVIMDSDAGKERLLRIVRYRLMAMAVKRLGVDPFLNEICRLMFGKSTFKDQPELVEEWRARFAAVDVASTLVCLDALVNRDSLLDLLRQIEAPSLIMVGAEDASLPVPFSRRIHDALPNSEFVEIAAAGHLSALEQPGPVNQAIAGFLDRNFA